MKLGDSALLIQVDLEDLFMEYTVTTFGCHQPTSNILDQLNRRIEDDVELLYEAITQHANKHNISTTGGKLPDKCIKYPMLSYASILKLKKGVFYGYSSLIGQKWNLQGSLKKLFIERKQ